MIATIAVTPGEVFQVRVGHRGGHAGQNPAGQSVRGVGGYNGGGNGGRGSNGANGEIDNPYWGAGGGGATDVRRGAGSPGLAERILVAGGGGGTGHHAGSNTGDGGHAGKLGAAGQDGWPGVYSGCTLDQNGQITGTGSGQGKGGKGGAGGTNAGGGGGAKGSAEGVGPANTNGAGGALGTGGAGGDGRACGGRHAGGGGGGGWHGGGGAGGATFASYGGGGGGGSSFGPADASFETGAVSGFGYVEIRYTPQPGGTPRPDARVRRGTSGTFLGNNIYNGDAASQAVTGSAARGSSLVYQLSMQNDGTGPEKLKLKATGTAVTGYTVTYKVGTTDITSRVVAGTYETPLRAPGTQTIVTVTVRIGQGATVGSSVVRRLVVSSSTITTLKDVGKVTAKRA